MVELSSLSRWWCFDEGCLILLFIRHIDVVKVVCKYVCVLTVGSCGSLGEQYGIEFAQRMFLSL